MVADESLRVSAEISGSPDAGKSGQTEGLQEGAGCCPRSQGKKRVPVMDSCMKPEMSVMVDNLLVITGNLTSDSRSTSCMVKIPDI